MDLCMFIDSNHASNKETMRSSTGFMIYMNISLINWYFKKHSTKETSVFGTDVVTMKVRVEMVCAI